MTIPDVIPAWISNGVPLNSPVAVSKLAHAGLLVMLKVNGVSLSTSSATGVKL